MRVIRYGSLFSGIGAFDEGIAAAFGGQLQQVWNVEKDAYCRAVLRKHHPHAKQFDDVCTVGAHNLEPVDIIIGSPPCQDLSLAGKRAGLAGKKSSLWFEYLRIVRELRPRLLVFENVSAAISPIRVPGGDARSVVEQAALGRILGDLADERYDAWWRCLRASNVGAPHKRNRLFVVAWRAELADAEGEREREPSATTDTISARREAWEVFGSGSESGLADAGSIGRIGIEADSEGRIADGAPSGRTTLHGVAERTRAGNEGLDDSDCGRREGPHGQVQSGRDAAVVASKARGLADADRSRLESREGVLGREAESDDGREAPGLADADDHAKQQSAGRQGRRGAVVDGETGLADPSRRTRLGSTPGQAGHAAQRGEELADADCDGRQGLAEQVRESQVDEETSQRYDADRRHSRMANADCAGLEVSVEGEAGEECAAVERSDPGPRSVKSGVGQLSNGSSARLERPSRPDPRGSKDAFDRDAARAEAEECWPARPGERQHDWEPPRTAHKVAFRAQRLKSLGNAVNPQTATVIGHVAHMIYEHLFDRRSTDVDPHPASPHPASPLDTDSVDADSPLAAEPPCGFCSAEPKAKHYSNSYHVMQKGTDVITAQPGYESPHLGIPKR